MNRLEESIQKTIHHKIIMNDEKILVVDGECLRFEERSKMGIKEDCLFKICCYNNTGISKGSPVILKVSYNGTNRIICIRENVNVKDVYAKQEDQLLGYIEGSSHEAVFFLQIMKGKKNYFKMESSLWPNWFLSLEEGRLVLKEAGDDVVEGFKLVDPWRKKPIFFFKA